MSEGRCRACESSLSTVTQVTLWDGHDYCEECVERACTGMADYARCHEVLKDTIPYDGKGTWRDMLIQFGSIGLALGLVAPVLAYTADMMAAIIWLGFTAGFLIFILGFIRLAMLATPRMLPTVWIHDGQVEIFRQFYRDGQKPIVQFALANSHWYRGRLHQDSGCEGRGGVIVKDVPAIILLTRPTVKFLATRSLPSTACGSSPELRNFFQGFFQIAGVVEGR